MGWNIFRRPKRKSCEHIAPSNRIEIKGRPCLDITEAESFCDLQHKVAKLQYTLEYLRRELGI